MRTPVAKERRRFRWDLADVLGQEEASISVDDWTMWTNVYNFTTGEFRVAYRRNYDDVYADCLKLR